jgi:hypothetical protein
MPIGHFFHKNNKLETEWRGQLIFLKIMASDGDELKGQLYEQGIQPSMSQKGALQNILWLDFHDKIPPTI